MRHDPDRDFQVLSPSVDGDSTGSNMMHVRRGRLVAAFPWLLALLAVGYIAFHWSDPVTLAPERLFDDSPIFGYKEPPGPLLAFAVRTTLGAGLLVSVLAIVLAAWQRLRGEGRVPDARLVTATVAGLAVHAHFLLIGLTGVVATRYAGAMGPLLAISGALAASWILERIALPRIRGLWRTGALSRRFAR